MGVQGNITQWGHNTNSIKKGTTLEYINSCHIWHIQEVTSCQGQVSSRNFNQT